MNEEFNALIENGTWIIISPKPNKTKKTIDGSLKYYKAQLVSKGYHQQ